MGFEDIRLAFVDTDYKLIDTVTGTPKLLPRSHDIIELKQDELRSQRYVVKEVVHRYVKSTHARLAAVLIVVSTEEAWLRDHKAKLVVLPAPAPLRSSAPKKRRTATQATNDRFGQLRKQEERVAYTPVVPYYGIQASAAEKRAWAAASPIGDLTKLGRFNRRMLAEDLGVLNDPVHKATYMRLPDELQGLCIKLHIDDTDWCDMPLSKLLVLLEKYQDAQPQGRTF